MRPSFFLIIASSHHPIISSVFFVPLRGFVSLHSMEVIGSHNLMSESSSSQITHRTRGLFFIGAAVALVGVTMAMQMGLNANFLSEDIGINGRQIGMLEAA
ncbi:MAG TPA: hypothetical protein VM223_00760, partial [Planctomycetota bacterium]|nr:hypothetical protein [Planctomycetota bacterium]